MDLKEKIEFYLKKEYNLYENFSREMLDTFPRDLLKRLGKALSGSYNIDIEKSEFTEAPKTSPGKMKDKIIICYFNEMDYGKPGYVIIENSDDGKIIDVISSNPRSTRFKNKKQAIENADKIFVLTKANSVSNYDIKKLRRASKEGAIALDRDNDNYFSDKSGYDVLRAKRNLEARLYARTKNSREKKVMDSFKAMIKPISDYLNKLSAGEIPDYNEIKKYEQIISDLMRVTSSLALYKNGEIPNYAMDSLEKILGIK